MMLVRIEQAKPSDAPILAGLVGELLQEIMAVIGMKAFEFSLADTQTRARGWLADGSYTAFLALEDERAVGFLALSEARALYAEGAFGIIPELYVRPDWRSRGVGGQMLSAAKQVARSKGWSRLEVTTPPLPQFDRTLLFYQQQGFSISGGRKMKIDLS